jgi:hypothetical protein
MIQLGGLIGSTQTTERTGPQVSPRHPVTPQLTYPRAVPVAGCCRHSLPQGDNGNPIAGRIPRQWLVPGISTTAIPTIPRKRLEWHFAALEGLRTPGLRPRH